MVLQMVQTLPTCHDVLYTGRLEDTHVCLRECSVFSVRVCELYLQAGFEMPSALQLTHESV